MEKCHVQRKSLLDMNVILWCKILIVELFVFAKITDIRSIFKLLTHCLHENGKTSKYFSTTHIFWSLIQKRPFASEKMRWCTRFTVIIYPARKKYKQPSLYTSAHRYVGSCFLSHFLGVYHSKLAVLRFEKLLEFMEDL